MKIDMSFLAKGLIGVAVCSAIMLVRTDPAQAILEGSNRDRMEYLDFSENMIKTSLYAKTGKATFNRSKKKFVRGVTRHNEPKIYQPDVYTWELAMAEHRKKIASMTTEPDVPTPMVTPVAMEAEAVIPCEPAPCVAATPCADPCAVPPCAVPPCAIAPSPYAQMPAQNCDTGCRVESIKQRIIQHMNSLDSKEALNIPALQPAMPYAPKGHRGDSCDAAY